MCSTSNSIVLMSHGAVALKSVISIAYNILSLTVLRSRCISSTLFAKVISILHSLYSAGLTDSRNLTLANVASETFGTSTSFAKDRVYGIIPATLSLDMDFLFIYFVEFGTCTPSLKYIVLISLLFVFASTLIVLTLCSSVLIPETLTSFFAESAFTLLNLSSSSVSSVFLYK